MIKPFISLSFLFTSFISASYSIENDRTRGDIHGNYDIFLESKKIITKFNKKEKVDLILQHPDLRSTFNRCVAPLKIRWKNTKKNIENKIVIVSCASDINNKPWNIELKTFDSTFELPITILNAGQAFLDNEDGGNENYMLQTPNDFPPVPKCKLPLTTHWLNKTKNVADLAVRCSKSDRVGDNRKKWVYKLKVIIN
jgi:hypothetical protein